MDAFDKILDKLARGEDVVIVSLGETELHGIEAIMAMGSPTVDEWYLNQGSDSPDIPERERLS